MSVKTGLRKLFNMYTKTEIGRRLGIKYQAMQNWDQRNEMPCTEYNGKTNYSLDIEEMTNGKVTVVELLGFEPHPIAWERQRRADKLAANG